MKKKREKEGSGWARQLFIVNVKYRGGCAGKGGWARVQLLYPHTHTERKKRTIHRWRREPPPPPPHIDIYVQNSDEILLRHFPYLLLVVFLWTIRQTAGWLSYRILRVGGRHFDVIVERERVYYRVVCALWQRKYHFALTVGNPVDDEWWQYVTDTLAKAQGNINIKGTE
jgi:hypothetical protein